MWSECEVEGAAGNFTADARQFPLVGLRWTGQLEDAEMLEGFAAWVEEFTEYLGVAQQPVVVVVDMRQAQRPTGVFRRGLIKLRISHRAVLDRWVIHDVVVTNNATVRGMLQTLTWVMPWVPLTAVGDFDEGLGLARDLLRERGVLDPNVGSATLFGESSARP